MVSSDIRSFARDSSENAERIKDLVRVIHGQVNAIRRDLDQLIAPPRQRGPEEPRCLTETLDAVEASGNALRVHQRGYRPRRRRHGGGQSTKSCSPERSKSPQPRRNRAAASAQAALAATPAIPGSSRIWQPAIEEIALLAEELQTSGQAERAAAGAIAENGAVLTFASGRGQLRRAQS